MVDAFHPTHLALPALNALRPLARHLVFPVQAAPGSALAGRNASGLSRIKGQGMEFDDVRVYQVGDDVRNIDWRVTARTGQAHTKQFRQEKEHPTWIVSDFTGAMQFGSQCQLKSVLAGHLTALLAWHARSRGERVGGVMFNNSHQQIIAPANADNAVYRLLRHACELQNQQALTLEGLEKALDSALQSALHQANPGSLICVISDWQTLSDDTIKYLHQLNQHHNLVLYQLVDPLEQGSMQKSGESSARRHAALWVTDGQKSQHRYLIPREADNERLRRITNNLVTFTTQYPLAEQVYVQRVPVYA